MDVSRETSKIINILLIYMLKIAFLQLESCGKLSKCFTWNVDLKRLKSFTVQVLEKLKFSLWIYGTDIPGDNRI